ncbi:drug/metabolite transporter (DMT)-like permease [Catenuloplanes nepalensis]|uniref:Drug/metabolite transporter (DMT)-like permease n=1 Tax=Catenuloplanes nepalensis TaxID=587533 RepID=A0ABT9MV71_9ACTN|nr:hypothetical protein [Catenuloplanes nepalensis]MDP9794916.1 drug/metabolite transporter (DMT)-like permease [Catenuloplanes nepalensis]
MSTLSGADGAMVTCDALDWSPVGSAASHSQLGGVVAGLVFAAIIVIVERPSSASRPTEALTMFLAGFFTFALDSFLFAVVAGDHTCPRAWTETMLGAGLLGYGAVSLFVGIAWLLYERGLHDTVPFQVTRVIVYALVLIEIAQLNVTARDYLQDIRGSGSSGWLGALLSVGLVIGVALLAVHALLAGRLCRWSRAAVGVSAYVAIGYALASALAFGLATAVTPGYWSDVRPAAYVTVTLGSVVLPTLVVIIQLLALPHRNTGPGTAAPGGACVP